MVRIDYFKMLQEITTKFVIVVNYEKNNKIRSGLFTNCSKYYSEKNLTERPEDIYNEKLVGWDINNNEWVEIDTNSNKTCYIWNDFEILGVDFTYEMVFAEEEDIEKYNNKVIEDYNSNIKIIDTIFNTIERDYKVFNTESFKERFRSLMNLNNFFDMQDLDNHLMFCALISTDISELREENLDAIKPRWFGLIEKHSEKIYIELEKELDMLDRQTESFEHEQEEIEIIKSLIKESISETNENIEKAESLEELFSLYPPLMLPYPYDISSDSYSLIKEEICLEKLSKL